MGIETERLMQWRWRGDDAEASAALISDSEVIAWFGRRGPVTLAETCDDTRRFDAHFDAHGIGPWAAETRADGASIGLCGLRRMLADDHPMTPCVEKDRVAVAALHTVARLHDGSRARGAHRRFRQYSANRSIRVDGCRESSVTTHHVQDRHAAKGFARFRSPRACGRASAASTRRTSDSAENVALIELRRISMFARGAPIAAACDMHDPCARGPRETHHPLTATARPRETAPCRRSRRRARAMRARA